MGATASSMNSIFIHDLRLETRIGIYDWEQHLPQTLRVDLEFGLSSDAAFRSDDFEDALDYAAVVKRVQGLAASGGSRRWPSPRAATSSRCAAP